MQIFFHKLQIVYTVYFSEPSDESQQFEDEADSWATPARATNVTSTEGQMAMHNRVQVQFDPPKVPVIFVLGNYILLIIYNYQLSELQKHIQCAK